jgi:hypothetical protein
LQKKRIVRQDDDSFDSLFDFLIDARLISTGSLEKILVIDESLLVSVALVDKGSESFQYECFIILEEHKLLDVLVELLIRIEREGIRVLCLSSDLQLLKSNLRLAILTLDLSLLINISNKRYLRCLHLHF